MTTVLANLGPRDTANVGAAPRQVRGSLVLDFQWDPSCGSTFLSSSSQEPPLRVVRPFRLGDGSVLVHLHNVSGGLLGGDELRSSVNVGPGASVQLTSTGATRIYRSRADQAATANFNDFTVRENALLEYVPDAIIPFAKARFRQVTSIELEHGAGLFWWEILAPGRSARGEVFEYDCVELRTDLKAEGRVIAAENVCLRPGSTELNSVARMGPCRYWVTFYVARVGLDAGVWLSAEEKLRETLRAFHKPGETLWGVSTLAAHGLAVRGLSRHSYELLPALRKVWASAKVLLYGREPILPRKVN